MYIPVAQRNKSGYVPVAERQPVDGRQIEEKPPINLYNQFVGTSSTPAMTDFGTGDFLKGAGKVAQTLGKGILTGEGAKEFAGGFVEGTPGAVGAMQRGLSVLTKKIGQGAKIISETANLPGQLTEFVTKGKIKAPDIEPTLFNKVSEKLAQTSDKNSEFSKNLLANGIDVKDSRTFIEKINSGDIRFLFREILGRNAPNLALTLGVSAPVSAITGGAFLPVLATAFTTSALLEGGSAYNEAKSFLENSDNEEFKKLAEDKQFLESVSIPVGIINGLLDSLLPTELLTKGATGNLIRKSVIKKVLTKVIGLGLSGGKEAGTESLQEVVSNAVAQTYDQNRSLFANIPEAALGGFLLGGGADITTTVAEKGIGAVKKGVELYQQMTPTERQAGFARLPFGEPEDLSETTKKVRAERLEGGKSKLAAGFDSVLDVPLAKEAQKMELSDFKKQNGFYFEGDVSQNFYRGTAEDFWNDVNKARISKLPAQEFGETQEVAEEEPTKLSAEEDFQRAESEVLTELELSQKGERIFVETGEVKGVSSTFPKYVPEELRSRKLFDIVDELVMQKKEPRGKRQAKLMDIISQEIINRMDISLADEKATNDFLSQIDQRIEKEQNQFLKELEKNIVKGIREKRFTIKQVVKMSETAKKKGIKIGAKETREKILTQIRLKQGEASDVKQQIIDYAKAFLPPNVREGLLTDVKDAEKFDDLEKAKVRIQEIGEKSDIRNLKKEIAKQLSDIKPRKQAGKPRGKFTPFHQQVLDGIKEATKLTNEQAWVVIAENLKQTIISPETALQNKILDTFSDLNEKSSSELQKILDTITGIKEGGKIANELQKFNLSEQLDRKKNMVVDYSTNFKGLPKGVETTGKIHKTSTQRLRIWLKTLGKRWVLNWNGLMKVITFNSPISKQQGFLDAFDIMQNENSYKSLQSKYISDFNEAVARAYNIENKPSLIRRKIIETNKLVDLGVFKNSVGVEVELKFTKAEMMKFWAEFQDKSLNESFSDGNHFTSEIKQAIIKNLSQEDIAFAKEALKMWQNQYQVMNPVFSKINGVDLPQNDNYSPIRRVGFKIDSEKGFGEFIEEATYRRAVSPSAIKTRVKNTLPIEKQNIFEAIDRHFTETNYYVAWAEKMRELDTIFKDANVRMALEDNYGKEFILTVNNTISHISTRGNKSAGRYAPLDFFRKNFTIGALMLKPAIAVKQYVSILAYGEILTPKELALGIADFWKNPLTNAKILNEESIMIRERSSNLERDIKDAIKSDVFGRYSKRQSFINLSMLNVKLGDKASVLTGSWAMRRVRLKQGVDLKEVIREYETFSSETQQSSDLSQKSEIERGGSFAELFTMFMSSPRQYLAREVNAVRSLFQEGGTSKQNIKKVAKTLVIYHLILPMFFQFVSNFGGWDDEDKKEYIAAGILGSLNGLFVFGDIIEGVIRVAMGLRPWAIEVPIVTVGNDIQRGIRELDIGDIDLEDVLNASQEFAKAGNSLAIPAEQAMNMGTGVVQLMNGNTREGIGLIMGWSAYTLKNKETENKRQPRRSRKRENRTRENRVRRTRNR